MNISRILTLILTASLCINTVNAQTPEERIAEINKQLNSFNTNLTPEQRQDLVNEKDTLLNQAPTEKTEEQKSSEDTASRAGLLGTIATTGLKYITSPYVLGTAAVAGVGYGLYKGYQYITNKNVAAKEAAKQAEDTKKTAIELATTLEKVTAEHKKAIDIRTKELEKIEAETVQTQNSTTETTDKKSLIASDTTKKVHKKDSITTERRSRAPRRTTPHKHVRGSKKHAAQKA